MRDRRRVLLRAAPRTVLRGRGTWSPPAPRCRDRVRHGEPVAIAECIVCSDREADPDPPAVTAVLERGDPALSALIPDEVNGLVVEKPPLTEYALTPGDVGQAAYGELGARFETLVIAFIRDPRLSLYAMRVDGRSVATEVLEPFLATAGRYVGIAGLDSGPWALADVAGRWVWVRPSDNATLPGTHVYTWAADDVVFLMIGVNDDISRALLALLPGEPPPKPSPAPSSSPDSSASEEPSASPSGS